MLAVLMSMKPEWWEKILAGDKVLEIRKTHPQSKNHADLEWPLTVLVYVSGTGAVQGQFLCPGYTETNFMPYLEKLSCVPLAVLRKRYDKEDKQLSPMFSSFQPRTEPVCRDSR